ncbi:hypothetical protein O1611_g7100 [Lasiodiplodia mahajangana]|uniref:Uncharacterized protein n=1 Tax=Lasiodiplodia mahajangana TaxID=1108764 RepID=A0ACC2JH24_9PEZI|nr:hypothetical protein O1611_g7100 [Lasiodiplodia mahajangana]
MDTLTLFVFIIIIVVAIFIAIIKVGDRNKEVSIAKVEYGMAPHRRPRPILLGDLGQAHRTPAPHLRRHGLPYTLFVQPDSLTPWSWPWTMRTLYEP